MNAFDGSANVVEVLVSSANSGAILYAKKLCDNFSLLGFKNRGVKYEKIYEMNHINAPNIIFEMCFCDSMTDMVIYYNWSSLAYRFYNAIDSSIPIEPPTEAKAYGLKLNTYL